MQSRSSKVEGRTKPLGSGAEGKCGGLRIFEEGEHCFFV